MIKNDQLDKSVYLTRLYDYYEPLLTDKQCTYFEWYYIENFTLQEIADEFSVSRAAVSDSLDKIAKSLLSYEAYLKMNYHSDSIRIAIAKYKNGEIDVAALIAAIEEELI